MQRLMMCSSRSGGRARRSGTDASRWARVVFMVRILERGSDIHATEPHTVGMRVEFFRPEDPEKVVAVVSWDGHEAVLESAEDPATGAAVTRVFRPAPVATDDPSLITSAGSGVSLVEPGTLRWFRAAALTRGPKAGLSPRFLVSAPVGSGFDPASNYRSFRDQVARISLTD